jgi:predicted transcriptional regulator
MTDTTIPPAVAPKKIVRDALDRMPENMTLAQILDELALVAALEESMEDLRQGRTLTHEEVMERMKQRCSK